MSKASISMRAGLCAVLLAAPVLFQPVVHADTDLKFSDVVKEVRVSGDYRLRYDNQDFRDEPNHTALGEKYRERFRMRLRVGAEFILPYNAGAKFRLASGTGEQVSTNQTFTNNGGQKQVWIDLANVYWKPIDDLKLVGGKMENPLWTQASSDLNWDPDYNPEGAAENYSTLLGGQFKVFANALQMYTNENVQVGADKKANQKEFSEQIGAEMRLPFETRIKLAYAYHDFQNVQNSTLTASPGSIQEGNSYTTGSAIGLFNDYGVSEIQSEISGWAGRIPVSVQGTFIKNMRAKPNPVLQTDKRDKGYQVGTVIGQAKEAKSFEVAYFYKYLEADATPSDIADSDFGDGGTNRYGHIMWVAYNPTSWFQIKTKYWMTHNIEQSSTLAYGTSATSNQRKGDINRLQVDAVVKF